MVSMRGIDSEKKMAALRGGSLIYLIADAPFSEDLLAKLKQKNYYVKYFSELSDLETVCVDEKPALVILDIGLIRNKDLATEVISRLKANLEVCPPLIVVSALDDIEVRLAALRAGAESYFCKPLDTRVIIRTLDDLTSRSQAKPYRVLLVDDDEVALQVYATMLREAGMEVEALSEPLLSLKVLARFSPDVLITDIYMDKCSGIELAQVIRQDTAFAKLPVMFLSCEQDHELQKEAMSIGADDFLVKPVSAEILVMTVVARAQRARLINKINTDIETVLKENEFELATMNKHDIVSVSDIDGQITSVNDRFCDASGYSREELLGQNHRMVKSGLHPDSFYDDMWDTITKGKIWRGTICNHRKDGDEYWVESTIVPFLDNKGKPYKYVSARTDITELRQSEERLHRSQTFANIGTWDWNIVTGKLYWSERIGPLFGYEKDTLETSYDNFIDAVHPEDRQSVIDAVNNCVEHGKEYNIEHRVIWPGGEVRWLLERGDVIRDGKGKPQHMLGVVQDITDRKNIELALKGSESQLREAQALAKIGHWQADIVSGDLVWSDEIYRIFGYEPGSFEPSVEAFNNAVHPDDIKLVRKSEEQARQSGLHDVVHRIVRPDGTIRHVHELGQAETDDAGNLIRLTGTVQDVTERVESETRLRESEERFVFAVEGAGDGVWDWDILSNAMQFSARYMEMLGYAENELPHHADTWVNSVHPDDMPYVQQNLQDYLEGRKSVYNVELRLQCKDGSYKWILCRGTVAKRDEKGEAVRMIGIHTDINKRKQSEEKLHRYNDILERVAKGEKSKDVLSAIVEHAETMLGGGICSILQVDHSGKYLVDGVAPNLPDFYNEAINGIKIGMGVGSCGESAFSGKRVIASDTKKHPNWAAYRELIKKVGLRACWSEPVFSSSGNVLGTFSIYYPMVREPEDEDLKITSELAQFVSIVLERGKAQQALVDAKEVAETANQAKSQFLSSMSHELRTPMNAIMGFGQLLAIEADSELTESQQENVDEIIKASKHLLSIINEVLDLAKIEAGRIDLSIETVIVGEVVLEATKLIAPLAQKRGIEISMLQDGIEISQDPLQMLKKGLRADHVRLKQVLLNLLSNAVKYNKENGKLTIACDSVADKRLRISITDTGVGLNFEQQAQLFTAFKRLVPEQSNIEGTGIGLLLAKNIVELMGGKIGVFSKPGEGSTFWFELPSDDVTSVKRSPHDEINVNLQSIVSHPKKQHTVLYIEDNPANLRLVKRLLGQRPSIHMWSAHEPLLGLELAVEHQPDLILLDINLPGMDGYEVLDHLRSERATRDIKVIAVSANAMHTNIKTGLDAGFDDYITKPIDVVSFLHSVDVALKLKEM